MECDWVRAAMCHQRCLAAAMGKVIEIDTPERSLGSTTIQRRPAPFFAEQRLLW